ncbi:H-NS histone family protein [Paraburkholderia mimosarum]|uniref:H-NS histone family protein n=1 Tax=Paraburkholderia mimosarum TaxID=312026 RepID=UPI0009E0B359|nr:H-NS histone family protein [Paraburkholderia mimosarum]
MVATVTLSIRTTSARLAEFEEVLADIRAKVADYGFTERDIFGRRRGTRATPGGGVVPPKYRDPKTGATWSGRGRAPNWIKGAKNRDRYLIGD